MKLLLLGQRSDDFRGLVQALSLEISAASLAIRLIACDSLPAPFESSLTVTADDLILLHESAASAVIDWRRQLMASGVAFQVIHPSSAGPVQAALWAVGHHMQRRGASSPWGLRDEIPARWKGVCESCSDPECEHRLFRRLLTPPVPPAQI